MSHHHRRAAAVSAPDPYFSNTVLLLTGNGTNGGQNNTFIDSSSNNFTITRNGNTTQGTFSPFGWQWSNYFDGTGDSLTFPGITLSGDFCCECWYYRTANSTNYSVIFGGSSVSGANNNQFYVTNTGGLSFVLSATGIINNAGTAFVNNTWNHLAYVRSGTNCAVFVNGVRQGTGTSNIATSVCSRIGDIAGLAGYQPIGNISNARIVSGSSVYDPTQTTLTVPANPLTAITNTRLLTCQSNRFVDNSSNAFAITRNGDVAVSNFSPFPAGEYATSVEGGSGYFDGSGDYLSIANNSALQLGSGDYTVEAWVYLTKTTNTYASGICGTYAATGSDVGWLIGISATGYPLFGSQGNGSGGFSIVSSSAISANSWVHLAATRSGTTVRLFMNGTQVGSTTSSLNEAYTGTFTIGSYYVYFLSPNTGNSQVSITGNISNLRILKGTAQYTANFTPSTTPLTAITNTSLLLNFVNASIIDSTGKNNLETVGNAQISTSVKKYGTGSMAFDGSGDYLFLPASNDLAFGTGDFTIEFWIYLNSTTGSQNIYDPRTTGSQVIPVLYAQNGAIIYFVSNANRIVGSTLSASTWYHIAVSRSGTSTKLFVDGTQSGSTYTDSNNYIAGRLAVGAYVPNTINAFNGYMDDLRVTKGIARYTSNFTPPYRQLPTR